MLKPVGEAARLVEGPAEEWPKCQVWRRTKHATLSRPDKVEGTSVYDRNGNNLGTISNAMLDKRSGQVAYAVLSFGGFLGMGSSLPWDQLHYVLNQGGYLVTSPRSSSKGRRPTQLRKRRARKIPLTVAASTRITGRGGQTISSEERCEEPPGSLAQCIPSEGTSGPALGTASTIACR